MSKIKSFLSDIAPNAYWDATKFVAYLLGGAVMSSGVMSGLVQLLTTTSFNAIIFLGLFVISVLLITAGYIIGKLQKQPPKENIQEQNADKNENDSGVVGVSATRSNTTSAVAVLAAIVLTVLIGGFFLGRLSVSPSKDDIDLQGFHDPTRHIKVIGKKFSNQRVPIDGYHYEDCTFTNVTFVYNGKSGFGFKHNELNGGYIVDTDNPSINAAIALYKGLSVIRKDVPLLDSDGETPQNVEPLRIIPPSKN